MRIKELQIDVFGGLKDRKLTFEDGLNLIEGENESGKSTVMLFIKFMLYGLPRKGNEERDRSVSRQEHCARGSMTLSHGGEDYRIERSFVEAGRGGSEKLSIYRLSDGEEVFRGQEAGEVFLKVPKEVFESSAFVGQMMCEMSGGKKGAEAIRNLLTTADEHTDLSKIEERLERIRVGYRHRSGKGGKLPDMSAEIQREKQRLERAVADGLRKTELEEKSARLSEQCADAEERLRKANAVLRQVAKIDLVHRFDSLRQKESELRRAEAELLDRKESEEIAESLLNEREAARLCTLADQMEAAEEKKRLAAEEYERILSSMNFNPEDAALGERVEEDGGADAVFWRVEKLCKTKRTLRWLGGLLLLGGVGGALLSMKLWASILGAVGGGAAGALGLVLLIGSVSLARKASAVAREYGATCATLGEYVYGCMDDLERKREFDVLKRRGEEELRISSARLRETAEWMQSELDRFEDSADKEPTAEVARAYAGRIRDFLAAYDAAKNRRDVLYHGVEEMKKQLSSYDEEALREELCAAGMTGRPVDLARAEQEQRWVQTQRDLLRQKREAVETERIALSATVEDPMPIADRLSEMQKRYAEADEYYESLEMALEALREAGDVMSGNVTPILGKRAGEIMGYLSGGRYSDFFAGSDLIPSLEHKDGFRVPSELLSGGTRDAAYLALRISLMLQIFEGELPPLVLDESLCQLDDGRMGRVLELLSKFSESQLQCLLFTCQRREADRCRAEGYACNVIRL